MATPERLVLFGGCDARQSFNGRFEYQLRSGGAHVLDADNEVIEYDKAAERYVVRVGAGRIKVRPLNLRL